MFNAAVVILNAAAAAGLQCHLLESFVSDTAGPLPFER